MVTIEFNTSPIDVFHQNFNEIHFQVGHTYWLKGYELELWKFSLQSMLKDPEVHKEKIKTILANSRDDTC